MPVVATRRAFVCDLAAALVAPGARAAEPLSAVARVATIEAAAGGRLGVAVVDAAGGLSLAHRADERFPMCSTFKALAAAAALKRVDAGADTLDRRIAFGPADLLEYAPIAKAHVGAGAMSLADVCAAALQWSDNTAANLLLKTIGGPPAVTAFARALGDSVTRLDRDEPTLNTAIPGDPRDTTSPAAMAADLRALILGETLSAASRRQLEAWMAGDRVGDKRLRAGLPADWGIADKTGTGDHGAANAIAILRPPARSPLFVAVYFAESDRSPDERNAVHRDVARVIAETM
jgi:beta-lactamase class A